MTNNPPSAPGTPHSTESPQQPETETDVKWLDFAKTKGLIQRGLPNLPSSVTKSVLNLLVEQGTLHGDNGSRSKKWCANCATRLIESADGSDTIAQVMDRVSSEGRRLVPLKATALAETLNKKSQDRHKASGVHLAISSQTIQIAAGLGLIRHVAAPGYDALRYSQDDAVRVLGDDQSLLAFRDKIAAMTQDECRAAIRQSRTTIEASWATTTSGHA